MYPKSKIILYCRKSARYVCPVKTCAGAEGNRYVRVHLPGASEAQTIRYSPSLSWSNPSYVGGILKY